MKSTDLPGQASADAQSFRHSWDTAYVPKRKRFDYFQETICRDLMAVTSHRPVEGDISSRIGLVSLPGGSIVRVNVSPHFVERTSTDLSRLSDDRFCLYLQSGGYEIKTIGDKKLETKPGDIRLSSFCKTFSDKILPGAALEVTGLLFAPPKLRNIVSLDFQIEKLLSTQTRLGSTLSNCLSIVRNRFALGSQEELTCLFDAAISLAAADLVNDRDFLQATSADQVTVRKGIVASIDHFIEQNLGRSDLSSKLVAAQFGISERYVHKLFSSGRRTFGGYVLQQRLERVREDLFNPSYRDLSISQIAFRWGFRDQSTFNRNFKLAFDATPRQLRSILPK